MSFEVLISTYGYAALAIGTLLEGETILVLAGFAAHQGYLKLPWVVFYGFLGTLCGDQFAFYLGRIQGIKILDRRPSWRSKSKRVFDLMRRHQTWLILGFRFFYGFRTITPFLLGAAKIGPLPYLVLNILGASLWTVAIALCGFLFGHVAELFLGKIKRYEGVFFLGLIVIGVVVWIFYWRGKHKTAARLKG